MFLDKIYQNKDIIESWLKEYEDKNSLIPIYLSTDIRLSNHKISVIDANLFPAGFNNIPLIELIQSKEIIQKAITSKINGCKNILLFIENHTRNKWYLENIYHLKILLEEAGFYVVITANILDDFFINNEPQEVETQLENKFTIYPASLITQNGTLQNIKFDLIILNNDLIKEIPLALSNVQIPILPNPQAGWHRRLKSCHFEVANNLLTELSHLINIDPWFISCKYKSLSNININNETDIEKIYDTASDLLKNIQEKYNEYKIKDKPYIILKSNNGTYGMGIITIEDPNELKQLNRKKRNNLSVGKNSTEITSYILQEGVATNLQVENQSAEVCLYLINNQYIGSFYRIHANKNDKGILNSPGMNFKFINSKNEIAENIIYNYLTLSRIAGIACMKEIKYLINTNEICFSN